MSNPYIISYKNSQLELVKELEERRCDLLAQIDLADSDKESTSSVSKSSLKSLYNGIIEEQWSLRCGSFSDPLVAFPEDIWQSIIAQVVDDSDIEWPESSLLSLLHVSRLWMTKLVSSPVLWTTITINGDEEDLLAKVAVSLHLSEKSNLKIRLTSDVPRALPKELFDIITPHTHRIVDLSFVIWGSDYVGKTVQAIQLLGHLPSLKWIRNYPNEITMEGINGILRYVPYLCGVESADVSASDLVDPCSLLANGVSFKLTIEEKLPDIMCSYKHLQNLEVSGNYIGLLDILSRLNCPLVTLSVDIPTKAFGAFVESIARFKYLESLEVGLRIRSQIQDPEITPGILPPILSIKSLWLSFKIYGEDSDIVGKESSEFDADITSIVEQSMPHIESLSLWGVPITSGLLSLLQTSYRLRSLTIRAHSGLPLSTDHSPIHLPQLEYLMWDFNSANMLRFHPLIASSVATCAFMGGYFDTSIDLNVTSAVLLPQGCSNSLVRLSIGTTLPFHLSLNDLSALRELEFGYDTHNCWIGDVLEQLIVFPSMCPTLRKLIFLKFCREWDILFLALERRNFLSNCTVSLIREIEMPITPSYSFLYPLTQLLGGKFPSYLSANQYATLGFDDISDRQICYHCRLSSDRFQRWEEMSTNISEDWGWTYRSSIPGERSDPPLKASVKDWIAGKSDRRLQIKESVRRALKRGAEFGLCGNCVTQSRPVVITAHSLDGTHLGDIVRPR
ncbi:hypothetical protein FRC19_010307 [Serendipita sp. 401]|nr:hypothetical protein FRC19_010307 [Serendipita sp. 401]